MKSITNLKLVVFIVLMLGSSVTVLQAQFEYAWTGGLPGYSGELFLSTSSGSGSASELLSDSFFTIPAEIINGMSEPAMTYDLPDSFTGSLTWNPTKITSMSISGLSGSADGGDSFDYGKVEIGAGSSPGQNYISLEAMDLTYSGGDHDTTGHWIASAPEPSILGLTTIGMFTLIGINFFRRSPK